ncbi:helix-turn-helix domain-containing protein [Streptomyces sp. NBC_01142]|uniref:helix-turn-helix domain-containing protein n=1 Tax=Streptomyces sp. NBC_01142 TaxID=2975865 RepID=UPI00225AB791|nr:helix-turn-helix transcriptional regulator [Streptomyces sp. NBC_01142]MCX4826896.1 helix-turn-helix domain-containing protein [Streptomyces sp. NBC_01142]
MPNASTASASTPDVVARRRAFGLRLRQLRTRAKRTQASVAAEAGVDRAFYVNVENGKNNISLDKIFALADALEVDVAELFRGLVILPADPEPHS